jgi:hypothetical protein
LEFSPDLVWVKNRGLSSNNVLQDIVRGFGTTTLLSSNNTNAEGASDDGVVNAATSDGFTVYYGGGGNTGTNTNKLNNTYVAWTWDAGSSTVTNNDGSITSTVRANPSAGFSVVTWSGNGSAGVTVGHGLGVQPSIVIIKCRTSATDWHTYVRALDSTGRYQLYLNKTDGSTDFGSVFFAPTSSVITLTGGTSIGINGSGETYVAYCFAPVEGYSAFGSYTGNGSADGPFVYTGFRPRWILLKTSNASDDWRLYDTARSSYNVAQTQLFPNLSLAEITNSVYDLDIVSNGFKLRTTNTDFNGSGDIVIYAAFAENPFRSSRAR